MSAALRRSAGAGARACRRGAVVGALVVAMVVAMVGAMVGELAALSGCGGEAEVPLDAAARGSPATRVERDPPVVLRQPQPLVAREGESAMFVVEAQGTPPLAYQWQRDGVSIAGAQQPVLVLASVLRGDDGARYSVRVSHADGAVQSATAQLRVQAAGWRADWE